MKYMYRALQPTEPQMALCRDGPGHQGLSHPRNALYQDVPWAMSPTSMRSSTSRFPITTRDMFSFNRNNWLGMAEPSERKNLFP